MDGVPLKMPQTVSQEVKQPSEVIVPEYLTVLQETEVSVQSIPYSETHSVCCFNTIDI